MLHRLQSPWVALVALGLALIAPTPGGADLAPDPILSGAPERELDRSLRAEKLIRAREQATRLTRRDPSSIIGHFVLAVVFHDEEANLPRALHHVRRAGRLLTARFGARPVNPRVQSWHRRFFEEEINLLGEMDRRTEQLATLDHHDALYKPKLDRLRIWPLMKLHRFEEATRLAKKVSQSTNRYRRIAGLNGLLALQCERLRVRQCFQVGLQAIEAIGGQSCILLANTAEGAFAVYRFEEAERLALKSINAPIQDCPASAHPYLANLYLVRADFQRAMAAVKAARQHPIKRKFRQQFEMGNTAWLARLLLVLGKFKEAEVLTERVVNLPDRVGMTSFSSQIIKSITLIDHPAALRARMEELRERASARPLSLKIKIWISLAKLEAEAWSTRHRATKLLAAKDTLILLLRPYLKPLPPWSASEIIHLVGGGVTLAALRQARLREQLPDDTAPYFDALEGEVLYREGQLTQALTLARRATKDLPQDEVLLRGKIEAWAADAAWRTGKPQEAVALYHRVLHRFPTALRLQGLALPVKIDADSRPLSQAVARALHFSRRLSHGASGFAVVVTTKKGRVRICLQGGDGRQYACAEEKVSTAKTRDEQITACIDTFHEKIFAPKIDLTQQDINSLDGSAVRGDADDLLHQVLGP